MTEWSVFLIGHWITWSEKNMLDEDNVLGEGRVSGTDHMETDHKLTLLRVG